MRRRNKPGCLPPRGKVAEAPPEGEALETQKRGRFRALSDRQKIAFLPYCVCRGDHWSPANLPQQRIFRNSFLQGERARASHARPYNTLF